MLGRMSRLIASRSGRSSGGGTSGIGEAAKLKDDDGKTLLHNPVVPAPGQDIPATFRAYMLDKQIEAGAIALGCGLAFRSVVSMIQQKDKLDATESRKKAMSMLIPGVVMQPSGIFANVLAQQALLAAFDTMLKASKNARVIAVTSSVATKPRAFWGAYAASKAAFETLLLCYAEEVKNISKIRVAIVDPGATRTAMRAKAYPGEDPQTVKLPSEVAEQVVALLGKQFATGRRQSVNTAS